MSGIEKRIKKHACIFVKDLSFISVRYITFYLAPEAHYWILKNVVAHLELE